MAERSPIKHACTSYIVSHLNNTDRDHRIEDRLEENSPNQFPMHSEEFSYYRYCNTSGSSI